MNSHSHVTPATMQARYSVVGLDGFLALTAFSCTISFRPMMTQCLQYITVILIILKEAFENAKKYIAYKIGRQRSSFG